MSIRIILTTSSTDENWNGDCDYAVVGLEPSDLRRLRELAAGAKRLDATWAGALKCVELYSSEAEFYSATAIDDRLPDEVAQQLEQVGFAVLSDAVSLDGAEPERTDGGVIGVHVYRDGATFYWGCYPKYAESITIESTDVPLVWLKELLDTAHAKYTRSPNAIRKENVPCQHHNSSSRSKGVC